MGCTFKARLNSLGSIFYTIFVLLIQSYLLYLGFERYKLYNEMKWPTGGYPHVWLTSYIALYAACIPMSLLFFAFGFFKSGNIAGDNERLADREERIIEVSRNRKGEKTGCIHRLKALWQHSPPMPQQLHVMMAFCQLVAQQLMMAQLYRHGFINSGDFLNTEMDFVFQRARQLATNLPMGDTRLQGFRITAEELAGSPLAPNLLPLLMHVRLFGISLEFVNIAFALLMFSSAYASVFWRVNKGFGLIFALHLLIYSISNVSSYLSFSILFRIQETNFNSLRPVGLGQYLVNSRISLFLHPLAIIAEFVAQYILTTIALVSFYTFGYNRYHVSMKKLRGKHHARLECSGAHSEYSNYTNKSHRRSDYDDVCFEGFGSHACAIVLLVLITLVKFPYIYAFMVLFQNDEKAILLSGMFWEALYILSGLLIWIFLTCKRKWNFDVAHKAHQIYALQKGAATGHIRGNENPSQLKNAMIVIQQDRMFVTDDQAAKESLLRHIQKGHLEPADDTFWNKQNGNQGGSPGTRKMQLDGTMKNTPEMARLMRRPSDDNSQSVAYQSVTRSSHQHQPQPISSLTMRGNSSPPEGHNNSFGTLQRTQQSNYMSTLQRNQQGSGTLQRSMPPGQWPTQQEAYASIHKQKPSDSFQRHDSNDGVQYGQIENNYSTYGTYARVPNQTRIPVQPGQQVHAMRINGATYGVQQGTIQRRPSDSNQPVQIGGVRQSPLLSERGGLPSTALSNSNTREQSPYQRSAVKLSSFNGQDKGGVYNSAPTQWGTQRAAPPGQPSQLLWNQNKPSLSASSSQQDAQCFTPTSTLTSQGSASNYSAQHTPTPSSPQAMSTYSRTNGGGGIYGTLGDDTYAERTLQKPPPIKQATGSTSIRHAVKVVPGRNDDSANFSLASSGSSDTARQANSDYATSIV